ncbi:MAG: hypothetical protein IVW52_05280 [Acidimicrobiales bacterium]|nr:hypothetical protein [Acidimicrobiales bacterium]
MVEFLIVGSENLQGSRIILPVAFATVLPGVVMPVSGTVTTAGSGTVVVGTILNAPLVTVQGTVVSQGTISVGTVTAVVQIGTVNVVGTLDAVLGTVSVAVVSGTVQIVGTLPTTVLGGTIQSQPASYLFTSVSATVKGSPGVLYQVNAAGESGLVAGPGTLLVLDGVATVLVVPVAAGGFQSAPFGPGVGFGTLIGSIVGSVDATFVFR